MTADGMRISHTVLKWAGRKIDFRSKMITVEACMKTISISFERYAKESRVLLCSAIRKHDMHEFRCKYLFLARLSGIFRTDIS